MKTLRRLFSICVGSVIALSAQAQTATTATYVGDSGGLWSNPANWSPQVVPNDDGTHLYDVRVGAALPGVFVDIDATLHSLTLTEDGAAVWPMDHNFTSAATSLGPTFAGEPYGGGFFLLSATHRSIVANLGNLADFTGTTFTSGNLLADASSADAGVSSTIRFNGADIVESSGDIEFAGARSFIQDENGNDAIRHFQHNLPSGIFHFEYGHSFTTEGSLHNEGETHVFAMFTGTPIDPSDHGLAALTTLTVNGDLTMYGPDAEGYVEMISKGTGKDAQLTVNGVITEYDPATQTLIGGQYELTAGEGAASIVQVLGAPFDIVDIESFVSLVGPNTGFRDSTGADALRNLAQAGPNSYFRIGDRDFTTAGAFASSGILTIRGNSRFTVSGDLDASGLLHVSEQTGYNQEEKLENYAGATEFGNSLVQVNGNLTLADSSMTRFDLTASSNTAKVQVSGTASLAGTLTVFLIDSLDGSHPDPASGNGRTLMTASSFTGSFDNAKSGGRVLAYSSDRVRVSRFDGVIVGSYKATYSGSALAISDFQPHASMLNISTRLNVQPGENAGIGGFIVRGGTAKTVLIRAIGPSLASKGVAGALQDPTLELHDASGKTIQSNDNWQDSQADDIKATGIAPGDPRESALIATLDPGSYTAVIRGANNSSGVALVELYDIDEQPSGSEFANLSTRGRVGTDENAMIGGVIVGPDAPANMVVRALGPSLAGKGVAGSLQDPTLELHDASGATIAQNDNWLIDNGTSAAQFEQEGLAPEDYRESALQVTLQPGKYTAVVRGKNNTQGVALVEFFKLN